MVDVKRMAAIVPLLAALVWLGYPAGQARAADAGFGSGNYAPLPDSGQTKCYDTSGEEIPCADTGQDGAYRGLAHSFTVQDPAGNGQEVVLDDNTGLAWMRADDGTARTWQQAVDYCQDLTYAGFSDWRLPEIFELTTIVDYGRVKPAIDTSVFSVRSSFYWSSTSDASSSKRGAGVFFDDGSDGVLGKGSAAYVRCVRGGR